MVYRNEHFNCNESECKNLTAYVRIDGKWIRIGHYGSECKKFEYLDLEQEEKDRMVKQQLAHIKSEIKNMRNRK
jgi:hypothetical protein